MVGRIGMFGSCVRGGQSEGSDIDVLVEFAGDVSMFEFKEMEAPLSGGIRAGATIYTIP